MKQAWRWFGPADTIKIEQLLQVGVEGVVSALHHRLPGEVWSIEEIKQRQHDIAFSSDGVPTGFSWDVVESVPVSEEIKTQTGQYKVHVDAYRQTIRNLASCGITTLCYNFMPILDWTRTTLRATQPNGGTAMLFDLNDFAAFDIFILKRKQAREDYSDPFIAVAEKRFLDMTDNRKLELSRNIVAGLPGAAETLSLDDIKARLSTYDAISADRLRQNLVDFLSEVIPTAQEVGVNLCCHPDDPPFNLLGLPRIMSSRDDYAYIMQAVDIPQNGITFCTGSLGVDPQFNGPDFVKRLGKHIHFVHLRNTERHAPDDMNRTSFHESEHLKGDTDMVGTIKCLLEEEARRKQEGRVDFEIPMRPDHGHDLLDDLNRDAMPGYPLIGRMRGLAELRGVMEGIKFSF